MRTRGERRREAEWSMPEVARSAYTHARTHARVHTAGCVRVCVRACELPHAAVFLRPVASHRSRLPPARPQITSPPRCFCLEGVMRLCVYERVCFWISD